MIEPQIDTLFFDIASRLLNAEPEALISTADVNPEEASIRIVGAEIETANAVELEVEDNQGPQEKEPAVRNAITPYVKRVRNKGHRKFVASQSCLVCRRTPSHAHHVKFAQPRAMARKVSDEWTVPLCYNQHRALHDRGDEKAWWGDQKIDPIDVATQFWTKTRTGKASI